MCKTKNTTYTTRTPTAVPAATPSTSGTLSEKEQVLADLDESDADIEAGRIKDAHQAMNDIRMRLGMLI